jgi:prevent-host-death family protein
MSIDGIFQSDHNSHINRQSRQRRPRHETQPGVAALKANLSSYLLRVKAGNEVVITERGLPVAKIVPLPSGGQDNSREHRLIKAGLLIPATGKLPAWLLQQRTGPSRETRNTTAGSGVLDALVEERREGR